MHKIICFGEIIVDFIAKGISNSLTDSVVFEKFCGGAPANTASALGRLSADVAILGSIGSDFFGAFLKKSLAKSGVDITHIQALNNRPTAVVFASLSPQKIPQFHSFGTGMAYNYFIANKKVFELIAQSKIFHFTSIPLIEGKSRKETLKILAAARKAGAIISFDPNIRLHLFKSKGEAKKLAQEVLHFLQIMKFGKDEFQLLFGHRPLEKVCEKLEKQGAKLILITDGQKGSQFYFKGHLKKAPAYSVIVKDTIGAGDAFMAGILYKVSSFTEINEISIEQMVEFVRFANAVAAISTTKRGATTAQPSEKQATRFLLSRKKN